MNPAILKRTIFDSLLFGYLFCVLIAFIFSPNEEQLLMLARNSLIFFVSVATGGALSFFMNASGLKTLGEIIFEPQNKKALAPNSPLLKSFWGWQLIIFGIVTLIVGALMTKFSFYKLLDRDSFEPTLKLFSSLANPNWSVLPRAILMMLETVFLAFTATVLAIPIAFALCFFAAKNIMKTPITFSIYILIRAIMNITRSVEAFVWAIIFTVWVGIGPFAGMLALLIHSVVSLAKQYSELVEVVDEGPIEAIKSTGANTMQVIWYAIVPQVILPFISFTIYRWDINIRMATIVGFVGGGGIGFLLQTYSSQAMWSEVGTIIVVIAFVVWFMDTASAYIREALK